MKTGDGEQIQVWFVAGLNGDRAAYEAALKAIAPHLRTYLHPRLGRAGDVSNLEDVVQTILIAIHEKRATYERSRPLMPWVYGIAHFKLLQELRSNRRRRAVFSGQALDAVAQTAINPQTTDPAAASDVARLIGDLSPEQRDAVRLTKLEGLSMRDAADRQGIGLSAMKLRVHRAMQRLKKLSE